MTDQELRDLVAENSKQIAELRKSQERSKKENDEGFRALRESLARSKEENDKGFRELREGLTRSQEENDMGFRELREIKRLSDEEFHKLGKELRNLGSEIGHIGNSFGRFTEGLFLPSLEKILLKDFGMDTVAPRIKRQRNGSNVELDVLSYSNSEKNTAIVVEIKSNLKYDDIIEFLDLLKTFPKFFPEHKDKKIYGMMAAVSISPELKAKIEKFGLYVVKISDETFRLISDKKFNAKDFGLKK